MPINLVSELNQVRVRDLILSKTSDVAKVGESFYCMRCYVDHRRVVPLNKIRDDESKFNCPYCSAIKIF